MSYKIIRPRRLKPKAVRKAIKKAIVDEGKEHRRLLNHTTLTWTGAKPTFVSLVGDADDITVLSGAAGDSKGANKWMWLNKGTRVRWALMSGDWSSKTHPNELAAARGSGRALVRGKGAMTRHGLQARPGIQARNWDKIITKQRKKPFRRNILKAINDNFR